MRGLGVMQNGVTDTQTHTQTLTQPFIVKDIYRIYHVKITPSVQNVLLETYID